MLITKVFRIGNSNRPSVSRPFNPDVHLTTPPVHFSHERNQIAIETNTKLMQMRFCFCCYRELSLKPAHRLRSDKSRVFIENLCREGEEVDSE